MLKEIIFHIKIPARVDAPESKLYVELHTKKNSQRDQRPIIFLLPGGPGNDHRVFKRHSVELGEIARLVYIDPRGCGKSERNEISSYTMSNFIQDIEVIRKTLSNENKDFSNIGFEKIILLGISYGGMVAQGYALKYPENLAKLIVISTVPSFHFIETAKNNLNIIGTKEQIEVAQKLWNGNFTNGEQWVEYFRIMKPLYSHHKTLEGEQENLLLQKDSMSYECLNLGFSNFLKKFNYVSQLHKIKCSTLILCGKKDFICDYRYSILMANKIPNTYLLIYDCPHAVPIDEHDDYINVTKSFILDEKIQSAFLANIQDYNIDNFLGDIK